MYRRKNLEESARAERWKREDDSPRLSVEVEGLQSLRLELVEQRDNQTTPGSRRVQHIVVGRAGALFEVPCSEPRCQNGGHDLTMSILRDLRARAERFEGTSECSGEVAERPCDRVLHYVAVATYK